MSPTTRCLSWIQTPLPLTNKLAEGVGVNMKDVGKNVVTGFVDGIKSKSSDYSNAAKDLINGFKDSITSNSSMSKSSITTWANDLKKWFTENGYGGINKTTWQNYAKDIVTGFSTGITSNYTSSKSSITTWASNIKSWFTGSSYGNISKTQWSTYAKDIVTGFSSGITSNYSTSKNGITTWASDIKKWFTNSSYGGVSSDTWKTYGKNIVTGFTSGVTSNYSSSETSLKTWGKNTVSWFEKPFGNNTTIADKFKQIGKNVVQGFIDGMDSLLWSARQKVNELAKLAKEAAESSLEIGSPSKVFAEIGRFVVQGFNVGIDSQMGSSFKLMNTWLDGVSAFTPTVGFAVDTSALKYYNSDSFERTVMAGISATSAYMVESSFDSADFKEAMIEALNDSGLVADMRRQADKQEQTIVQVGDRTITDAVARQQRANGYVFAR